MTNYTYEQKITIRDNLKYIEHLCHLAIIKINEDDEELGTLDDILSDIKRFAKSVTEKE